MGAAYLFFSPSGISARSRSSRCCSEVDQACLYVSDFGFSLAVGGSEGTSSGSVSCLVFRVRIFAFVG